MACINVLVHNSLVFPPCPTFHSPWLCEKIGNMLNSIENRNMCVCVYISFLLFFACVMCKWYMCVVCEHIGMHMFMHICAPVYIQRGREGCRVPCFIALYLSPLRRGWQLASPGNPLVSAQHNTGMTATPTFYMDPSYLNSGSHACMGT